MTMTRIPRRCSSPAVAAAALLLLVSCKPKTENPPSPPAPPAPRPAATKVQSETDRLRGRPLVHEPSQRPLILSERAPNRRDWALRALERGYAESGHTNVQWDASVHAAFVAFADCTREARADRYDPMVAAIAAAVGAHCDDPMLQYMEVRYRLADRPGSSEAFALAALRAHESLCDSRYHPVFKFYAGYRAVEAARTAEPKGDRSVRFAFTTAALEDLARDTNAPPDEVFDPAFLWVDYTHAKWWLDFVLGDLQPILERNWGREEPWFRFRGLVEIQRAWEARGTGFANTVNDQGWEGFRKHLSQAESSLTKAWQMNSNVARTAYLMMDLELGHGRGRETMETWFNRAMALDTNYYDAAKLMSYYLEPRWYGSEEEALAFARTCATQGKWGGSVPLVLVDTHRSLAGYYKLTDSPQYWQRPEVWRDVQLSWESFFRLNPEAVNWRHNYAKDAYLCGHYAEFLQQARRFSAGTNFAYFGGEQKFQEMVAKAAAATGPGP